jgi:hypothetical protein
MQHTVVWVRFAYPLGTAPPSGRSSAAAAALAASQEGAARKGLPPEADATSAPGAVPMRWLSCTSDISAYRGGIYSIGTTFAASSYTGIYCKQDSAEADASVWL